MFTFLRRRVSEDISKQSPDFSALRNKADKAGLQAQVRR